MNLLAGIPLLVVTLMVLVAGVGCAATPHAGPFPDPAKPHHTADGFRNNYPHEEHGFPWKWMWERFWNDLPKEPEGGYHPEVLHPTPEQLKTNPSLTWIGHATLLLRVGGLTVLTDPQFSERASPFTFMGPKRRVPPALALADLPHIDVVIISHNHYDHLDEASVEGLAAQPGGSPRFFVPLGMKAWFAEQDIHDVVELDWWEHSDYKGLTLYLTPAQHFSSRSPFDRNQVLWGSWIVDHPTFRFFFTGDSGYSQDFRDIGERFGPIDLAAIPIGAYEPRWFMKSMHVNPAEAVQVSKDLRAHYAVAMHWGTFTMTDEPIDEPPKALARAREAAGIPPERFFVMKFGEVRDLDSIVAQHGTAGR